MKRAYYKALAALTVVLAAVIVACTPAQEAKTITAIGNGGACVLNHPEAAPEVIAKDCGIAAIPDVIAILLAAEHHAARRCPAIVPDAGARDVLYGPGK